MKRTRRRERTKSTRRKNLIQLHLILREFFALSRLRVLLLLVTCYLSLVIGGCERGGAQPTVVLYTSIDEPIARLIVREYEKATGTRVILVTDAEATKSVGLAERVRAEGKNPQCDVFWSNEPFHTINLAEEGLLTPYDSPLAVDVAEKFKDPQHRWHGNGLRARVIAHAPGQAVSRLEDLLKPELKNRIAMAQPVAGTTAGHVAAMYVLWGEERAKKFFHDLRGNGVQLLGGNSKVAEAVADGTMLAGLTDNDDVFAAKSNGGKIESALADQDGMGTLMIPTTVGIVKGAPHFSEAKKLVNYLLSPEVEKQLIDANFASWSVRGKLDVKAMDVDYAAVAKVMPRASREARDILVGRE